MTAKRPTKAATDITNLKRDANTAAKSIDVLTRRVEILEKCLEDIGETLEKMLKVLKESEPRTWSQWLRGE